MAIKPWRRLTAASSKSVSDRLIVEYAVCRMPL